MFQETSVEFVHVIGASMVLGFGVVYEFLQTAISFQMHPSYNGLRICKIRLVISIISVIGFLTSKRIHSLHIDFLTWTLTQIYLDKLMIHKGLRSKVEHTQKVICPLPLINMYPTQYILTSNHNIPVLVFQFQLFADQLSIF